MHHNSTFETSNHMSLMCPSQMSLMSFMCYAALRLKTTNLRPFQPNPVEMVGLHFFIVIDFFMIDLEMQKDFIA